LASTFDL